jgi:hypothetical protein
VFAELAKGALDTLGGAEELAGSEGGLAKDDTVEELIIRLESPRLGLNKRGLANHQSYSFAYQRYRLANNILTVTEITPES